MANIELLNEETIDKIAAGEVVERPASIVKELVENAIDAHATAITIEVKEGGISFIRVTDNGEGIARDQVKKAFYRHATSKLKNVEDLETLVSLGFRGEALSSIAAVSQVEMMTKTKDELIGTRYVIEGAVEKEFSEIGVPNGTTIIVRNVFFNTPARRKFLKTANTELGYISDICEHLALSVPNVSFKFVSGGQLKFNTSGDGDLKEVIYRLYGKDVAGEMIPIEHENKDIRLKGYLGKPVLNRSNRNFEKYFINGRFVKSNMIAAASEAGYKAYLMQHKFPFFVLDIKVNTSAIDVNVHPTKMEVKFNNEEYISDFIETSICATLRVNEMIPDTVLVEELEEKIRPKERGPEPFEVTRSNLTGEHSTPDISGENITKNDIKSENEDLNVQRVSDNSLINDTIMRIMQNKIIGSTVAETGNYNAGKTGNVIKAEQTYMPLDTTQLNLFDEKLLSKDAMEDYRIIGQVFDTYWIIAYKDKMLIMDQHAAHEKVKYEAIISKLKEKVPDKQTLNPPIIITLSGKERAVLEKYKSYFDDMGYEFDDFGGGEIAIRSVPLDLYGLKEKEVFLEVLDELSTIGVTENIPEILNTRIATMACKAAVKGNNSMTTEELWELLCQLMSLDNPYNCPHGRPTIITISKYELEKKFKRIV
ncbi:MAG: DNA mismatch repair endonuclease MutL [Lachnospiraceae bacterium]|nr:DNA mismatch repair endonuclease MutL [Lachnospiraceae bacterium]